MLISPQSSVSLRDGSKRAFTIVEILVVVGIIVLLIAILVPVLGNVKTSAKKTATRAVLSSLQTGLNQYYSDFNAYPDSREIAPGSTTTSTTGAYGPANSAIGPNRGPAMLAQALMGYLPGDLDGAGPTAAATPAFQNDPRLGFRTRTAIVNSLAVGKVYGPYAPNSPPSYKVNLDAAPNYDQSFYDTFGNEILYFRSEVTSTTSATPLKIFDASTVIPNDSIFFSDDNLKGPPPTSATNSDPSVKTTINNIKVADDDFFKLLAGTKVSGTTNTMAAYGQPVLGRDSFLLLSAGPDGIYYSSDDIVMSNH